MDKPIGTFGRDFEWSELVRFASNPERTATLGIVSGRSRRGKTSLLHALCRQENGFYYCAQDGLKVESLYHFGHVLARYIGQRSPFRFTGWDEAIEMLMGVFAESDRPVPVVIDEFQALAMNAPELLSVIQHALWSGGLDASPPVRLLLCGSALSFMGELSKGASPLHGCASLELVVRALDYRSAAEFWRISDPRLAVLMNAVVGGVPAYAVGGTPRDLDDFDRWIVANLLDRNSPLFREARSVLTEDPEIHDAAMYQGVLSAVAEGNRTSGGIANFLKQKSTDLSHVLTVLEDIGMLAREPDVFREKCSTYRIAEPIVAFYQAVIRPEWSDLNRPDGLVAEVWSRRQANFLSNVVGPHFENICREWVRWYAAEETIGGRRSRVAAGVVSDAGTKCGYEVDVAVFGGDDQREDLLAIGEAKWNQIMGIGHLTRLQEIRTLLGKRSDRDVSATRLLLFSGAGFTDELRERAKQSPEIVLVDLERLYSGT